MTDVKVQEMLAWLDGSDSLPAVDGQVQSIDARAEPERPSKAHGVRCLAILAESTVTTDGGSYDGHLCFEMAKPERGLVRIREQSADPSARVGVVRKTTWVVTDLGAAVAVADRKRKRRAEIRAAAVREISES